MNWRRGLSAGTGAALVMAVVLSVVPAPTTEVDRRLADAGITVVAGPEGAFEDLPGALGLAGVVLAYGLVVGVLWAALGAGQSPRWALLGLPVALGVVAAAGRWELRTVLGHVAFWVSFTGLLWWGDRRGEHLRR